ncbi:MAG: MFS transporter [Candidatus Korarchaeum sp.]|nr:MFS transporter [Candidatus Korarchaeum sp.]MDW8035602.1 MFS transporter [Candidatus Korarchaeum sp.]
MSRGSARTLAATFLVDIAWGLGSIYLTLEIYEELGLPSYFATMGINALAGFIGMLASGIAIDLLNLRRSFISIMILITSLSLICCALSNADLLLMSFFLGLLLSYEPVAVAYLGEEIEQGEASGIYYTVSRMGISLGTFLGGLLLDSLELRGLLILSSLLFLSIIPVIPDDVERFERARSSEGTPARALWFLVPIMLMESLIIPLTYSLLEIKLYDSLERSASLIGSLYSASIMLEVAASPLMGRLVDELGGLRSFLCSSAIYSVSLIACILLHDPTSLILIMILPTGPLYFSARNKLAVELAGRSDVLTLSLPISISSLSDALFYVVLSIIV